MNKLISADQAKQITGGRTPLVPVEYETAINALVACQTLDEAKYWSDKADALALWAKLYREDKALIEAKRLKLHAFRRCGEIAAELRPDGYRQGGKGRHKGALSLLVEKGWKQGAARCATQLARMPPKKFEPLIRMPDPPSPAKVVRAMVSGSDGWKLLRNSNALHAFASFCRNHEPGALASTLTDDEGRVFRNLAATIIVWLREFESCLKEKP